MDEQPCVQGRKDECYRVTSDVEISICTLDSLSCTPSSCKMRRLSSQSPRHFEEIISKRSTRQPTRCGVESYDKRSGRLEEVSGSENEDFTVEFLSGGRMSERQDQSW